MKILIIEDDEKIVNFLKKGLQEEGFSVDCSLDGEEGEYLACINNYDVILLDIMLPLRNGIDVCKELRKRQIHTPIIMLTAKNSIEDRVEGLNIGANDYIAKPFSFAELLARIRVQLRSKQNDTTQLQIADLKLDLLSKTAQRGDKKIELTSKEFSILELLIKHKNRVLSDTMINSLISNLEDYRVSNIVNVYIYRLRNKIDKDFDKKLIKTVRGLGFKISDE